MFLRFHSTAGLLSSSEWQTKRNFICSAQLWP